ncbi:MAG: ROK family protein [Verrucomicrobiota bacterium]
MNILVIDVGGTHIKVRATGHKTQVQIPSSPKMTANKMVAAVRKIIVGWKYDAITVGYPGLVLHGHIVGEPHNLGHGWVNFNFKKTFGSPVKIINNAMMQALGSYRGKRMLFLGLGTGLGSVIGQAGLKLLGKKKWRRHVNDVVKQLKAALEADYVVLGGGNPPHSGSVERRTGMDANRI